MSSLETSSAAIVAAVYDDAAESRLAAEELASTGMAIGRIRRLTMASDQPSLDASGLPAYAVERYRETLLRGRTIVVAKADVAHATAVDSVLRQHRPLESAVHSWDEGEADRTEGALPASVESTAALTPRPRGHRDPSA
jgi:hypothetical protein